MTQVPFFGPSYVAESTSFDCQRSINLYPVTSDSGTSKSKMGMAGTPGFKTFVTLPNSPIRGEWRVNSRVFAVGGNTLYEIFIDKSYVSRGQLNTSTGNIGISDNGQQLIIVDGPNGYILTMATNVFSQITAAGFRGSNTVTFIDGYFVCAQPDTQVFFISALYDGTSWDPLDFASAEGEPDNIVGLITVHKELWIFGTSTVQVYYNSGDQLFPFDPVSGGLIEYGCAAASSIAKTANTVFWIGQDDQGNGVVWMALGYQPQRVSTFAIEELLQTYGNLQNCSGYTYQEAGRYFYVASLLSANTSICYDIGVQLWHERQSLVNNQMTRHRAQSHVFAFGSMHLVGDFQNGNIYQQSLAFYDENGTQILRKRVSPHSAGPNLERVQYNALQIDIESGTGLVTGDAADVAPQLMLRWSNDGGHTWSKIYTANMGAIGRYKNRARWRRMGQARDRVYELTCSVRTKVFLNNAYLDINDGSA